MIFVGDFDDGVIFGSSQILFNFIQVIEVILLIFTKKQFVVVFVKQVGVLDLVGIFLFLIFASKMKIFLVLVRRDGPVRAVRGGEGDTKSNCGCSEAFDELHRCLHRSVCQIGLEISGCLRANK